jgi:type I restriction enzyme S subunit
MLDEKRRTGLNPRPYLRNANVLWHRFDLSDVFEMDFDEAERATFALRPGDLLLCEGGEPGRAAVWNGEIGECCFQKALHRCRFDEARADALYFAHLFWFLCHRGALIGRVTSATIAHLTAEKLKGLSVPLPPLALQKEFTRRVAVVGQLKAPQVASLAKLDSLFASLQHRAFRGEL